MISKQNLKIYEYYIPKVLIDIHVHSNPVDLHDCGHQATSIQSFFKIYHDKAEIIPTTKLRLL